MAPSKAVQPALAVSCFIVKIASASLAHTPSLAPICLTPEWAAADYVVSGALSATAACLATAALDLSRRGQVRTMQCVAWSAVVVPCLLLTGLFISGFRGRTGLKDDVRDARCEEASARGEFFVVKGLLEISAACAASTIAFAMLVVVCLGSTCYGPAAYAGTRWRKKQELDRRAELLLLVAPFSHPGPSNVDERAGSNAEDACSICLDEFRTGDRCKRLPCSRAHVFHVGCAACWLQRSNRCPLCRTDVVDLVASAAAEPLVASALHEMGAAIAPSSFKVMLNFTCFFSFVVLFCLISVVCPQCVEDCPHGVCV